ncbi:MAG: WYL domain-containing protein [Nevskiaceae bacterium]|nr:MAG: WYL domain-containing protein [Nevskiaceae bacterium]TBR74656.1 MAG: WYL domain-containing protein [Nevskiaceae bacterium]
MDRTERFQKIDRWLCTRRRTSLQFIMERLEISKSTAERDIRDMRDRLGAPIDNQREDGSGAGGYYYREGASFELPGLWLSAAEIEALLTLERLIVELQPSLLGPRLKPLSQRLEKLLADTLPANAELPKRVRILGSAFARDEPEHFERFAQATLERKRLHIHHYNRARNIRSERDISPQRLVRYRDNWYCDAWCHTKHGLRSFALDAVEQAKVLPYAADDIPDEQLDAQLGAGYGIFKSRQRHTARLRFTATAARWVSHEHWHPDQKGTWLADGHYLLEVPYSDDRELLMDLLRHGPEVEVLGPPELRKALIQRLDATRQNYAGGS